MKICFYTFFLFYFLPPLIFAQVPGFEVAKKQYEKQAYAQAIPFLEKLCESREATAEGYDVLIRCYAEQGWLLKMNGQDGTQSLVKAVELGEEAINKFPKNFLAYRGIGYAYHYNQLYTDAKAAYEMALQLNPQDALTYFLLWTVTTEETEKKVKSPLIKKALELDSTLVEAWQRLGDSYKELKQYENAISHYEKAAGIRPNHILYFSLGSLYAQQGDIDAAEKNYNSSIELQADFAYAHYGLGTVYLARENMDMAVKEIKLAIEINPAVYDYYEGLLSVYPDLAKYSIKKPKDKAIEKSSNQQASVPEYYNEAIELAQQKNYAEAIGKFTLAIETEQKKAFPNTGYIVSMFNWRLHCYFQIGNYTTAVRMAKEAIPYTETYGLRQDIASLYATMGAIYGDWGSYTEAIVFTEKSIDILRELKLLQNEALAFGNLCELYRTAGKFNKSIDFGRKAAELNKQIKNVVLEAQNYNSLSRTYLKKQQIDKAQEMVDIGFGLIKTEEDPAMHAELNLTQAEILNARKKFKEALRFFEKANAHFATHSNMLHLSYRRILRTKALIYANNDNINEAQAAFFLLFYVLDLRIKDYFPALSEEGKARFFRTLKDDFEVYSNFAIKHHTKHPELVYKMYQNQLQIKSLMLNTSEKMKHRILTGKDENLKQLFNEWQAKRNALAKLYVSDLKMGMNEEVKLLKDTIETLEVQLSTLSREFSGNIKRWKPESWEDIVKVLSKEQAVIELVRLRDFDFLSENSFGDSVRYAALILSGKTKSIRLVMLNNGIELEGRGFNYYSNAIRLHADNEKSYDVYFGAIGKNLEGIKTVYMCPDGVFYKINFNTLFNPHTKKYLAETIDFKLLTNSRDVLQKNLTETKERKTSAVLIGFPSYKSGSTEKVTAIADTYNQEVTRGSDLTAAGIRGSFKEIDDLPGTFDEIQSIEATLLSANWRVTKYLEENAREENIKTQVSPRILHIATHGYFEQTDSLSNPLLGSGLLLAGALANNGDFEDGVLTAYEAMNLNLDETQLVVLSACETGRGVIQNGEGVYGLQSAFKVAGAANIIMSLWKVDDRATQKLMTLFYKKYIQTGNAYASFKEAQLELRNEYNHPFYWGAFVLVGL